MAAHNSGIYEIVNTANGKRYVGSAVNFRKRWNVHRCDLRRALSRSPYLQAAWAKHGESEFQFNKLVICARKDLLMYEQLCIDGLKPEYNVALIAGNSLGVKQTLAARARMAAAQIGNKNALGHKVSAEARAKMSAPNIGNTIRRGSKHSVEARAKMSASMKGKKLSPEHCAKMALRMMGNTNTLGRKLSPEHVAKLIGNTHHLGHAHSDDAKIRIGVASRAMWAKRKQLKLQTSSRKDGVS